MREDDFKELRIWVKSLWKGESIPEELQPRIEHLLTPHVIEREVMQLIHEWLDFLRVSRKPGRIIAPPGTGKTVTCDVYRLLNKPVKVPGRRDIVPVLYLQAPQDCSVKELLILILELLKVDTSGEVATLRRRVRETLKVSQVKMIIIDEANLLNLKTFSEIARIYDLNKISIILVGTAELDTLIKVNEFIYDRFKECYSFDILTPKEFKEIVEICENEIVKLPVPSNLTQPDILNKLYQKTDGKMRHLDWILRKAGVFALKKGLNHIDKETLDEVLLRFG
jgi:DNA transposition AAA+ family ATPase